MKFAPDAEIELAIDEILRLDNPFVSNRRITRWPVKVAGQEIPSGARVKLNWTSANRDEVVFRAYSFDPIAHAQTNLVYGVGKHHCPGRWLGTWELRIAAQALLRTTENVDLDARQPPVREEAPLGGYQSVPVILS